MHRQVVVAEYTLGDEAGYHLTVIDAGRIWFGLKNYTGYKGKQFDYKTANQATAKDLKELLKLDVKN